MSGTYAAVLLAALAVGMVIVLVTAGYWTRPRSAPALNTLALPGEAPTQEPLSSATINPMQLTTSAWQQDGPIPARFTCDGENVSPPISIAEVPEGAQSLVLIVDDPDAPRGDWVHWTVWNMAPDTADIAEGAAPIGAAEGMTDFGEPGYGGPCPPSGEHRYQFKLYALDIMLDLPTSAKKADIEQAMVGHMLGQATLVGRYRRS